MILILLSFILVIGMFMLVQFINMFAMPLEGHTLVFANKGAGKTSLIAWRVHKELKRMKKGKSKFKGIGSNVPIHGCTIVDRKMIGTKQLEGWLLFIDEAGIEYNNRKMNMTAAEVKYHKLLRHYETTIVFISQDFEDLDITIRRLYDYLYFVKKSIGSFTRVKPIIKVFGIDETTHQPLSAYYFQPFKFIYFDRSKYYHMFDSWDAPVLEEFEPVQWYPDEDIDKDILLKRNRRILKLKGGKLDLYFNNKGKKRFDEGVKFEDLSKHRKESARRLKLRELHHRKQD